MSAPVRIGLIVGGIGLFINAAVSSLFGFCGPLLTLLAGCLAGFLVARQATAGSGEMTNTRAGAIAGAVTGAMMLIGQLIGAVLALVIIQAMGVQPIIGELPTDTSSQGIFYVAGIATGACFGIVGLVLALAGGAGVGALMKPNQ